MKFVSDGSLRMTFQVPYADKHKAVPVSDSYGLELDVHMARHRRRR